MGFKVCLLLISFICQFLLDDALSENNADFCTQPYCGEKNLACNNSEKMSKNCVTHSLSISMTRYRNGILNNFNEFRNKIAGGYTYKLFPAARMGVMSWSSELEYLARLVVINCRNVKHCLSSPDFYYVGLNTETVSYSGDLNNFRSSKVIENIIGNWKSKVLYINRSVTVHVPYIFTNNEVVKAALLIMDRNTQVGCAALRFSVQNIHNFSFACAFATEVFVHRSLYKRSLIPGNTCTNRDPTYKFLCAAGEEYDVNREIVGVKVYGTPIRSHL